MNAESDSQFQRASALLRSGRLGDAIAAFKSCLVQSPDSYQIHCALGAAYLQNSEYKEAESHLTRALELQADDPKTLNNLAVLRIIQQQDVEACGLLERVIALNPKDTNALNNLAHCLHRRGLLKEAEHGFRNALTINPQLAETKERLCHVLFARQDFSGLESLARAETERDPTNGAFWAYLGLALEGSGRCDEALNSFNRAIEAPKMARAAWLYALRLLEEQFPPEEGLAFINDRRSSVQFSNLTALAESRLLRKAGNTLEADALVLMLSPDPRKAERARDLFYEAATKYAASGDSNQAFECYEKSNSCLLAEPSLNALSLATVPARMVASEQLLRQSWLGRWKPAAAPASKLPRLSFVIGFPCSGQSLLGEILNSSTDPTLFQERPAMSHIAQAVAELTDQPYPDAIARLTEDEVALLRQAYFKIQEAYGTPREPKHIVDSATSNLTHLPLIYKLFPNAQIVIVTRNPCDTVLDCFTSRFPLDETSIHFLSLENTTYLFDGASRMLKKCMETLPFTYHSIRYEDLLDNPDHCAEQLAHFLGLSLKGTLNARADAPLTHPSPARTLGTPEHWVQFRSQLEPVLGILAPWTLEAGYSLPGFTPDPLQAAKARGQHYYALALPTLSREDPNGIMWSF